MNIDLTTAGVTGAILALVFLARRQFPKAVDGKEEVFALLFGIAYGIWRHIEHPETFAAGGAGWAQAVALGFATGIAAQLAYDKAVKPFLPGNPPASSSGLDRPGNPAPPTEKDSA